MNRFHVALEPGHGGDDDGECANGLNERVLNASQAWAASQVLTQRRYEVTILPQTQNGRKVAYPKRVQAANEADAVLVAIHFNGGGGRYSLVYYDADNPNGDRLAQCIARRYRALFGALASEVKVEGIRAGTDGHICIHGAKHSAALVEPLFLDTPEHAAWLKNHGNRLALAEALADAIEDYASTT